MGGALLRVESRSTAERKFLLRHKAHMRQSEKYVMPACEYIVEVDKWWAGELICNQILNFLRKNLPQTWGTLKKLGVLWRCSFDKTWQQLTSVWVRLRKYDVWGTTANGYLVRLPDHEICGTGRRNLQRWEMRVILVAVTMLCNEMVRWNEDQVRLEHLGSKDASKPLSGNITQVGGNTGLEFYR